MSITWQEYEKAEGVSEKYRRNKAAEMAPMMDTVVDSVLDLYAGKMLLKKFLSDRIQYYPVDYAFRCDQTIVCDFNQHQFPKIKADAVFISGCLEYVEDAEWFLKQIVKCCKREIILSYHPIERTADITIRKNHLWVNHYSTKELVQIIQKQGFLLTALQDFRSDDNTNEVLYKFKRAEPALLPEYIFCTGCATCRNVCPADAITMKPDRDGYLRPAVSSDKCIACGKCLQICPSLHPQYKNTKEPECYAVWADDSIREKSSSGGAFTLLANEIFQCGGYVCGAAWTEDFGVNHIIIHNPNELMHLCHSKYVQSNIGNCYSKIKELLQQNETVLFSGCPCQVAGLYSFLGKEYNNLYTDYWWCKSSDRELDDNKGTSTVLVNNRKGAELFEKIKPNFKLCRSVPLDNNRKTNRVSMHFAAHPGRDRFYELIQRLPFNKAVDYALNGKYDIGIVGDWSVENFGANLTYYALYHVVRDLGYEPLLIERPGNSPWRPNSVPACFQNNPYRPYDLSPIYPDKHCLIQR